MKGTQTKRLLPLLLALLLGLTACGASSAGTAAADTASSASYSSTTEEATETAEAVTEDSDTVSGSDAADAADYDPSQTKLIYTAELELEVLDFDAGIDGLEALVEQVGGYCQSSNFYNYGSSRSANYVVRVPSEQYEAFMEACGEWENCYLVSRSEWVEDVGEEYFDTESRLTTLRTKLERLQELLSQATEMEDIITIESAISDTEYQIEQYTSTLNRYDSLVDYATITLYLSEVVDLTEAEETSLLARLGQNLRWGAENFLSVLEELALWLAYHIIELVIFAALVVAAVLLLRRLRKGRKGKLPYAQTKPKQEEKPPEEKSE